MSTSTRYRFLSLGAVAAGAMALGMVIAGGLGVTPAGVAKETSASTASAAAGTPLGPTDFTYLFANLAEKVNPSVISVYTEDRVTPNEMRRFHQDMDPFEFFFGPNFRAPNTQAPRRIGAGSGFFIRSNGTAITNNHVVEGADKVWVRLADGTRHDAKVIGRDPATDVALIKVSGSGPFPPLPLGDSDTLRVGEWVMAAGNPLNMDHTITVGVVSAKNRSLGLSEEGRSFENFIQTDAAINLGNSGGPLVNVRGDVVGINTAINAAGQNLGFAVPINTAKMVIPQLEEKGKVVRGYLGVMISNVDEDTQKAFNLPGRDGAFVQSVEKDGPGDKAGIQKGDTLIAVNGTPIKETRQLIDRISMTAPGKTAEIELIRDGKKKTVTVTVGERPGNGESSAKSAQNGGSTQDKLGVAVDDLDARARRDMELPRDIQGVVVTNVTEDSPAEDGGLREGDVITEVSGAKVASVSDFRKALDQARPGARVPLYVYRPQAGRSMFVIVHLP
ncbi:MAG: Do family serine endopeptidase [Acidobacteriota bacterium]